MTDFDVLYTDVEDDLRATVHDLLSDRCEPAALARMADGDRAVVAPLWRSLSGDLGLAGLLVPEKYGGGGATAREAAVVLEEFGRGVAPVPFLTSGVVATTVLCSAPAGGAADDLLAGLARGVRTAAVLVPFPTAPGAPVPALTPDGSGRLHGLATSVAGVLEADVLLVPVSTRNGTAVHAVATRDVTVEPVASLDMTRQLADVRLVGATGVLVVPAELGAHAIGRALEAGAALLASEQAGIAQWCLGTTVAYLRQRRQFGRVIGGFQAVKHRLADLYVAVETAMATARYAAVALAAHDPDHPLATAVAQAWCADVAVRAAEEAVQLHGGIGMTWEHPAHLYLKRAKADQLALGSPARHRQRVAEFARLPAPLP